MLDAVVQFLRNGACCIKDLEALRDTFLWDPSHVTRYYDLPPPCNKTTPLELFIASMQLYAFFSCIASGYALISQSYGKRGRIQRLTMMEQIETFIVNARKKDREEGEGETKKKQDGKKDGKKEGASEESAAARATEAADDLIRVSFERESASAGRSMVIGFCVNCIGMGFFWLFCNSLHITETPWIGGTQGLINALTVQEIALVVLIVFMYYDGKRQIETSGAMRDVAATLRGGGGGGDENAVKDLARDYDLFLLASDWKPFWSDGIGMNEIANLDVESKQLREEKSNLTNVIETTFLGGGGSHGGKDVDEKEGKIRRETLENRANELEKNRRAVMMEGYREYLYLVLNAAAFYGYMLGIICYYDDDLEATPFFVHKLKFGMDNADADWHGNFVGDLAWTIEPAVILLSPLLLNSLKQQKATTATTTSGGTSTSTTDDSKTKKD